MANVLRPFDWISYAVCMSKVLTSRIYQYWKDISAQGWSFQYYHFLIVSSFISRYGSSCSQESKNSLFQSFLLLLFSLLYSLYFVLFYYDIVIEFVDEYVFLIKTISKVGLGFQLISLNKFWFNREFFSYFKFLPLISS